MVDWYTCSSRPPSRKSEFGVTYIYPTRGSDLFVKFLISVQNPLDGSKSWCYIALESWGVVKW